MAAGISPEEFRAYAALVASSTLLQRAVEKNLREQADLTQVQFEILMNLANAGDAGIRMAQLADTLHRVAQRTQLPGRPARVAPVDHPAAVHRRRARRRRPHHAEGERMRQRVFAGHIEIVRRAFLDAVEPSELATLTAILERVVGRLR